VQQIESDYSKLAVRVEHEAANQREEEERKKAERKARVEASRAERKKAQDEAERAASSVLSPDTTATPIMPASPPPKQLSPMKLEPLSGGKELTREQPYLQSSHEMLPGNIGTFV